MAKLSELLHPTDKQLQLLRHVGHGERVFFGGARGGAKSHGALIAGFAVCMKYEKITVCIVRRHYGELIDNFGKKLDIHFDPKIFGYKTYKKENKIRFQNGSEIVFRAVDTFEDLGKIQGVEFQLLIVDEANQFEEYMIQAMLGSLRDAHIKSEFIPSLVMTGNPGGLSDNYFKTRFISPDYEKWNDHELKYREKYVFISSSVYDNPHLAKDENYIDQLKSLPDDLRKAWLDGDWNTFAGQFFCLDDQTEILTKDGFKNCLEISKEDYVASLSPKNSIEYYQTEGSQIFDYDGDLICCENKITNFAVTPNHKMYVRKRNSDEYKFVDADCLPKESYIKKTALWEGTTPEYIEWEWESKRYVKVEKTCPICDKIYLTKSSKLKYGRGATCSQSCGRKLASKNYGKVKDTRNKLREDIISKNIIKRYKYKSEDFLELLGWYLSEGCIEYSGDNNKYYSSLCITQSFYEWKISRIKELLSRMEIDYAYDGKRFRVHDSGLCSYFERFGKSPDKYIPREILQFEKKDLERLFMGLVLGDGCPIGKDSYIYSTNSKRLSDDFQELCLKIGRYASQKIVNHENIKHNTSYRSTVYSSNYDEAYLSHKNIFKRSYIGKVGCVTVEPNHTIYIRRNGSCMWIGNSEWNPALHIVEDFPIPKEWVKIVGIDEGFQSHPTACLWTAQDPDTGNIYVYREYVAKGLTEDHAVIIKNMMQPEEDIVAWYADTSMFNVNARKSTDESSFRIFMSNGIPLTPANKNRIEGWRIVKQWLHWDRSKDPKLYFFRSCTNTIEKMPQMMYDQRKAAMRIEDLNTKQMDDELDALRYALVSGYGYPTGESLDSVNTLDEEDRTISLLHNSRTRPDNYEDGDNFNDFLRPFSNSYEKDCYVSDRSYYL